MTDNNLIERMIGMLPEGAKLEIRSGSLPKIPQTMITIRTNERLLSGGLKWPHTDDEFYLQFVDILTVWNEKS